MAMKHLLRGFVAFGCLLSSMLGADFAVAQKRGILKVTIDSPASMSILEEGTNSTEIPMMGVFNNLAMYDQHVAQNSLSTIVPDLATDLVDRRRREAADLSFAPGCQMARRQTLHRERRQVHLGHADRQVERKAPPQSAQVLVQTTSKRSPQTVTTRPPLF